MAKGSGLQVGIENVKPDSMLSNNVKAQQNLKKTLEALEGSGVEVTIAMFSSGCKVTYTNQDEGGFKRPLFSINCNVIGYREVYTNHSLRSEDFLSLLEEREHYLKSSNPMIDTHCNSYELEEFKSAVKKEKLAEDKTVCINDENKVFTLKQILVMFIGITALAVAAAVVGFKIIDNNKQEKPKDNKQEEFSMLKRKRFICSADNNLYN